MKKRVGPLISGLTLFCGCLFCKTGIAKAGWGLPPVASSTAADVPLMAG